MKYLFKKLIIIASLLTLGACSPESRKESSKAKTPENRATPDAEIPRPNVVDDGGFNVAHGATNLKEIKTVFDPSIKEMRLSGKIEYVPIKGEPLRTIDIDLAGKLDEQGYVNLKGDQQVFKNSERVAAKATCMSKTGTCEDSFIDLYIYVDGIVYHQQIESHEAKSNQADEAETTNKAGTAEATTDATDKNDSSKNHSNPDSAKSKDSEIFENEGDSEVEGNELGEPSSTVKEDIKVLLDIKPEEKPVEKPKEKGQNAPVEKANSNGAEVKKEEEKQTKTKEAEPKKSEEKTKQADPKVLPTQPKDPKDNDSAKDKPTEEKGPIFGDAWLAAFKVSQSQGAGNTGSLKNAADVLIYEQQHRPTGFHVIRPDRKTYFATNHILYLLAQMGRVTSENLPNYVLAVGDISYKNGGRLGSHLSHATGLDADIAYYFSNKSFQGYFASALAVDKPHPNWMYEEQWKLFKFAMKTQFVDRIFVHRVLKKKLCELAIQRGELQKGIKEGLAFETLRRLFPDGVHHNHFHLRVKFTLQSDAKRIMKCSTSNGKRVCRPVGEPAQESGCF